MAATAASCGRWPSPSPVRGPRSVGLRHDQQMFRRPHEDRHLAVLRHYLQPGFLERLLELMEGGDPPTEHGFGAAKMLDDQSRLAEQAVELAGIAKVAMRQSSAGRRKIER